VATAVLMVEKKATRGDFFSPTFSDINAHIQYYICTHIVDRLLKRLRSTRERERQGLPATSSFVIHYFLHSTTGSNPSVFFVPQHKEQQSAMRRLLL
jgi:hypothetical protein